MLSSTLLLSLDSSVDVTRSIKPSKIRVPREPIEIHRAPSSRCLGLKLHFTTLALGEPKAEDGRWNQTSYGS
jgi:hypothetical protein